MNFKNKILLVSLLLVSSFAFADGPCPDGTFNPGAGVCMCSKGGSVGPNQSCGGGGSFLISRWGAIAINFEAGHGGASSGDSTENQGRANEDALSRCKKYGGNCKIVVTYKNTCAALAWGSRSMGIGTNVNAQKAEHEAMQQCIQKGDKDCTLEVRAACAGSPES